MSARIAIDARKLPDFGIGTYLRGLISGLAGSDDGHRYYLFAPAAAVALLPSLPDRFEWVEESAPHYSRAELLAISRQARRVGADLLHSPHYVVPLAPPCPVVVTIHDAIHLTHPETLPRPRALAYGYARLMLTRAARLAERVIAVSNAAAAELEAELRIPRERIRVVPNGVDESFRPPSPPAWNPLADTATAVFTPLAGDRPPREAAGERPPEARTGPLLFVGNPKPHKNLHRLIEAYSRLVRRRGFAGVPPLRLVGGGHELAAERALRAHVRRLGLEPAVSFEGYVSGNELAELYRTASMLVFPTLTEGFGLPIAEAMACGTPVVVSDRPVHREIAGEAGELVDPLDPEAIAAGIARLLDDPALAARRAAAGLRRAGRYSWRECARRTLAVYDETLTGARYRRTEVP